MTRLSNRVFLVTGSTQGVGEGIARRLVAEGARGIVVTGRDRARGEAVAASLAQRGAEALFVRAELSDIDDCRALVAASHERFDCLDGLVSAAATSERGTLASTTVESWDRIFAVNLRAPFFLAQAVVARMRERARRGAIVHIGSMSGHGGQSFLTAYAASKGALAVMTKNLGHALRRDGIRVNCVNLGWTATPGEDAVQRATGAAPDWLERADDAAPLGRLIRPADVAGLVAYLLSDDAALMTGACVDFDQHVAGGYFDEITWGT